MTNWTSELDTSSTPSPCCERATPTRTMATTVDIPTVDKPAMNDDKRKSTSAQLQKAIIHNMVVVCVSFFLNIVSFAGLVNLQSSVNFKGSVGHVSLMLIFLMPIVSNLLVSAFVIQRLGSKWSMTVGQLLTCALAAASFFQSPALLYAGATVTGFAAGFMWSAHGSYVTALGRNYAALSGQRPQAIIGSFFGMFFMCHRLAMFAGSLVSSLVFQKPPHSRHLPPAVVSRICGSAYCYEDLESDHWFNGDDDDVFYKNTTSDARSSVYRPSLVQMYSLCAIYLVCNLIAPVLLLRFLKPLETMTSPATDATDKQREQQQRNKVQLWNNLGRTLRRMLDLKLLLLMPLTFLHGTSVAFITADYGVGFTSCTLGMDNVGYIMATFGVASSVCALSCGLLLKHTGRQVLFGFGAACCLATLVGMWKWVPSSDEPEILYLFAGMWGVCTTVLTTQLISLVGFLYDDKKANMAMACYYSLLNGSIGTWFIIGRNMCVHSQLQVLLLLLAIGIVGYTILEILIRKDERKTRDVHEQKSNVTASDVIAKC